jgi:hypothetical protein
VKSSTYKTPGDTLDAQVDFHVAVDRLLKDAERVRLAQQRLLDLARMPKSQGCGQVIR